MKIAEFFRRLFRFLAFWNRQQPELVQFTSSDSPKMKRVEDARMPISATAWRQEFRRRRRENAAWNRANPIKRPRATKRADIEKEMRAMFRVDDGFGGEQVQTAKTLRKRFIRLVIEQNRAHNRLHPDAMWPTSPKKIRRAIARRQREHRMAA